MDTTLTVLKHRTLLDNCNVFFSQPCLGLDAKMLVLLSEIWWRLLSDNRYHRLSVTPGLSEQSRRQVSLGLFGSQSHALNLGMQDAFSIKR